MSTSSIDPNVKSVHNEPSPPVETAKTGKSNRLILRVVSRIFQGIANALRSFKSLFRRANTDLHEGHVESLASKTEKTSESLLGHVSTDLAGEIGGKAPSTDLAGEIGGKAPSEPPSPPPSPPSRATTSQPAKSYELLSAIRTGTPLKHVVEGGKSPQKTDPLSNSLSRAIKGQPKPASEVQEGEESGEFALSEEEMARELAEAREKASKKAEEERAREVAAAKEKALQEAATEKKESKTDLPAEPKLATEKAAKEAQAALKAKEAQAALEAKVKARRKAMGIDEEPED